jgi:hypothetical protein
MNDWIDCFIVLCIVAFISYYIYRGIDDSLVDSSVGSIYSFRYFQPLTGEDERFLAKVICKRDMSNSIKRLNRISDYRLHDSKFQRTNTLVTCLLPNGDIRNFYAERADNCRKLLYGKLLYSTGLVYMI